MSEEFVLKKKLDHVAFIMDGNGRWANLRGLPRHLGHKEACMRLIEIYDLCREFNIKYSSFYAFSTENWNRPQDEIDHLMDHLEDFFARELNHVLETNGRILVSGDLSRIREKTRKACYDAMESTKNNDGFFFNICLNYGGRDEIVRAAKKFAEEYKNGQVELESLNDETFKKYLWQPNLPDIDLMIRTSGEQRLSNYLLYENAYAEFVFTNVKWPDFRRKAFIECLREYQNRNRRYGGLKNE